jgi:uncharacterized protein YndB with AHSA1/START domain
VRVSIAVDVDPELAFRVFTEETDLWWRRSPRFRLAGHRPGTLTFEPGVGGRLFESFQKTSRTHVFEVGRILVWEPGARLVFTWRGSNFAPGESTRVDVRFEASGGGQSTRVTLLHSGFARLRADHPVRHGQEVAEFIARLGMSWASLLGALRHHAATATPATD